MQKIFLVFFLVFSVIFLKAENFNKINTIKKRGELEGNTKKFFNAPSYHWLNFGGCWHLYRVEDGYYTPMNYTNYVGTTTICNEASANVC